MFKYKGGRKIHHFLKIAPYIEIFQIETFQQNT